MVKPFSPSELIARIKATLRRLTANGSFTDSKTFQLGEVLINYDERIVYVTGQPVQLTATEYKTAHRALQFRRQGSHTGRVASEGLGTGVLGGPPAFALLHKVPSPEAWRQCAESFVHLHRARYWLPYGKVFPRGRSSRTREFGTPRCRDSCPKEQTGFIKEQCTAPVYRKTTGLRWLVSSLSHDPPNESVREAS